MVRVALFAGPLEEIAKLHLLAEGAALEGRAVDMAVPRQVQVIDVFDGDCPCDHMYGVGMHRLSPGP